MKHKSRQIKGLLRILSPKPNSGGSRSTVFELDFCMQASFVILLWFLKKKWGSDPPPLGILGKMFNLSMQGVKTYVIDPKESISAIEIRFWPFVWPQIDLTGHKFVTAPLENFFLFPPRLLLLQFYFIYTYKQRRNNIWIRQLYNFWG